MIKTTETKEESSNIKKDGEKHTTAARETTRPTLVDGKPHGIKTGFNSARTQKDTTENMGKGVALKSRRRPRFVT